ncbi:MAG TPA: DUF1501 domain-containing protein [Herpetosiphon sp.]|uniref:DUF1501 domain-containing protein n=1 Tax=Herpetosiphon aurantiacus (strain ATCC 23779 / DSM 785 / 114-95) TaxID=316274 RepID=A9B6L5_HERA2|nr:DUF1501 domain-containing protein [Herpetosiphon sp.]ABX04324.1 protein of unknown function DUF1501 [Herpetosiphon aurantiacus DSM 785]HBW51928.1 DUF1501 domain-containing protein [Herpetosiphon sp.]
MLNRRQLLGLAPNFQVVQRQPIAVSPAQRDVLICVFQRGGADGLNMVVPHGEAAYYQARPNVAIAQPNQQLGAIDLDGFFGLHPSLEPFKEIWNAKQLAIVHACGSPDPTHSHFDAMDYMERGTPGQKSDPRGWLGRHLAATQQSNDSPFRAVGFGSLLQASLRGGSATALTSLEAFNLQANRLELPKLRAAHGQLYRGSGMLVGAAQQTFAALEIMQKLNPSQYQPSDGAVYPDSPYGKALKQIAQLIKADLGLEVACADIGDWDTHVNQGGADGEMAANLAEFAAGLRALYTDLSANLGRVTIVTMSEFGRRAAENGGGGTDHGHGNVMFVMGGNVTGGIYGTWPGLQPEQLYGPGDLAITSDFRDVLAEILQKRLRDQQLNELFPEYTPSQSYQLVR